MNESEPYNEIEQYIIKHLRENPQAGDTIEGIAGWWIMRQRLNECVDLVQQSLERLKARGLVTERKTADGRTLYTASAKIENQSDE